MPSTVKFPSITMLSVKLIVVESAELILVPRIVTPLAITPPVPLGDNVRSALLGVLIVEPMNQKSPNDTSANDNVPDPSVFKN